MTNPTHHPHLQTITAADLASCFGITLLKAHQLMRRPGFPHLKLGRHRVTTEPMLASWMAANVKNAPVIKNFDPLEAAVIEKAIWLIGELVKQGVLQVCGLPVAGGGLSPAFQPATHDPQPAIDSNPQPTTSKEAA